MLVYYSITRLEYEDDVLSPSLSYSSLFGNMRF
jgi:hypothetical protein